MPWRLQHAKYLPLIFDPLFSNFSIAPSKFLPFFLNPSKSPLFLHFHYFSLISSKKRCVVSDVVQLPYLSHFCNRTILKMTRFFTFSHPIHHLNPHKYWLQTTPLKFYYHFDQNQTFCTPLFCKFSFPKTQLQTSLLSYVFIPHLKKSKIHFCTHAWRPHFFDRKNMVPLISYLFCTKPL